MKRPKDWREATRWAPLGLLLRSDRFAVYGRTMKGRVFYHETRSLDHALSVPLAIGAVVVLRDGGPVHVLREVDG